MRFGPPSDSTPARPSAAGSDPPPEPQKMSPDGLALHIQAFKDAKTPAALKLAGDKAYAVADAMGDEEAKQSLQDAYKARKASLLKKEPV